MPTRPRERDPRAMNHPLENTLAAVMLTIACDASETSMTQLGRFMEYRNRSALSHMASGLAPISILSARRIARVVGLHEKSFLEAVMRQRYPDEVDFLLGEDPVPAAIVKAMRARLLAGDVDFARRAMPLLAAPVDAGTILRIAAL